MLPLLLRADAYAYAYAPVRRADRSRLRRPDRRRRRRRRAGLVTPAQREVLAFVDACNGPDTDAGRGRTALREEYERLWSDSELFGPSRGEGERDGQDTPDGGDGADAAT